MKPGSNGDLEFKSKNRSFFIPRKVYGARQIDTKTMKAPSRSTQRKGRGQYAGDHERWNAVVHRDPKADGIFYYSVKTTGVYCRPSCAARRARRENVQFHSSC